MPTGDSDLKSSAASAGVGDGCTQQQLRKSRTISGDSQAASSSASTAEFQVPPFPAFRRASSGPLPPQAASPVRLAVAVDDPSDSPAFQGPLFQAIRRASSGPVPPPPAGPARRLMVAVDDPSDAPANGGVLDRDWFYPSFLGPYPSRPRASARARPKPDPPKLRPPPPLPATSRNLEGDKQISEPEQAKVDKDALKRLPEKEQRKLVAVLPSTSTVASRGACRASNSFILLTVRDFFLFTAKKFPFGKFQVT